MLQLDISIYLARATKTARETTRGDLDPPIIPCWLRPII